MKLSCLAMMMTVAAMTVGGCGDGTGATSGQTSPDGGSTAAQVPTEDFELEGSWLYLGPSEDVAHTLAFTNKTLEYSDIAGDWSSSWSIKNYDNELHQFQIVFESGRGTHFPNGQEFSGTYVSKDRILTLQLAEGLESYLPLRSPGSCIEEGGELIPDCRLYMKQ